MNLLVCMHLCRYFALDQFGVSMGIGFREHRGVGYIQLSMNAPSPHPPTYVRVPQSWISFVLCLSVKCRNACGLGAGARWRTTGAARPWRTSCPRRTSSTKTTPPTCSPTRAAGAAAGAARGLGATPGPVFRFRRLIPSVFRFRFRRLAAMPAALLRPGAAAGAPLRPGGPRRPGIATGGEVIFTRPCIFRS
jgi:hypothetical protein